MADIILKRNQGFVGKNGKLLYGRFPQVVFYGALYNWYAATDARKISSSDDWIVPNSTQFITLIQYASTSYTDPNTNNGGLKLNETNTDYWSFIPVGRTNSLNFNGKGAGTRSHNGSFGNLKNELHITYTDDGGTGCGLGDICKIEAILGGYSDDRIRGMVYSGKRSGSSIRLLYAGAGTPTSYTGNDGKLYEVVTIGTQKWLAENLCETKFRNGDIIPWYGANPASYFTNAEWAALTTAGCCAYNNTLTNVCENFSFPT